MKIGKKNKIPTSILSYTMALIGESGIGKTTTVYEMCKKIDPKEDSVLFLEVGKEDGCKAIEGINYVTVDSFGEDYDEDKNTVGFETLVDTIVEEKTESFPNLVSVVVDSIDELLLICKEEVVRRYNKAHPDKKTTSIKSVYGGYFAGEDMSVQLMLDKLWELKKVGVSFIMIGHTRLREKTDEVSQESYTQLSTNMMLREFNTIKTKLDFLLVAYYDREIAKEKSKKDPKKTIGVITGESRKVVFRSNDFSMDSKARFADISEECNLDADSIINVMQEAINTAIKKANVNLEERKKEDDARLAKRQQEIAEAESEHKKKKELDTLISKIKDFVAVCKEKKDGESVKSLISKAKELGYEGPYDVSTVEDAQTLLRYIESLS